MDGRKRCVNRNQGQRKFQRGNGQVLNAAEWSGKKYN